MMGQNKDLSLPDCESDSELASKFNIFFIEKKYNKNKRRSRRARRLCTKQSIQ